MNNGDMSKFHGLIKMITNLLHNGTMDKLNDENFNDILNNTNWTRYFEILKGSKDEKHDYCIDVRDIAKAYSSTHGYISLIVCIFGTIANVLNIAVLTRKDMVCTPVNRILTGLAVADMMVMIEYIPFAYYYYFVFPVRNDFPYSWAVYMLFHTNFAQVLHTISICLTLALAIWRYIAIRYPERSHVLCTEHRCTLAISISYVLPILLCCPSYMVTEIRTTPVTENGKTYDLYHVDLSDFAKTNELFYVFCFWTYSVIIKLLPCLILTVISYWLIKALCGAKKRKQILRAYNKCPTMLEGPVRKPSKSERRTERTTKMLVAVLLLFLITEVPQGILGLLSGIFGKEFFRRCYHLTGEFMDILALLNGAINFILYCSMSRQFRTTFNQLFRPKMLAKYPPPSQEEVHTTYV